MKRDIEIELLRWKDEPSRMPLLLRGARQVGKTYIVEKFGREHFPQLVTINFEQRPELSRAFTTLDPAQIVQDLEVWTGTLIKPGSTLLFLDEIQECPRAILALRYFKEQMPQLHVIGAGSLLEFALRDPDFRMPVGRVEFMFLLPLFFQEFLSAIGNEPARRYLEEITLDQPTPDVIHSKLLEHVREYMAIGGMPAAVFAYVKGSGLLRCQEIQTNLLATYRKDFGKYSKQTQHKYLQKLFERAPALIAQWFKYAKVDPDMHPRSLRTALDLLADAGLLYRVHATSATGLPLFMTQSEKKFKILFIDVGLARRASQVHLKLLLDEDVMLIDRGAVAEQFVGQEILAHHNHREISRLFFWVREKRGSSAEVDYVTSVDSTIIPIEVKAGATGRLRSLKLFMEERGSPLGVRVSTRPLSMDGNLLSIPLYLLGQIPRLCRHVLKK